MPQATRHVCPWALSDPLSLAYHDKQWGIPLHDDLALFALLTLETFQAGLSWRLVLAKEAALRQALDGLDPRRLAGWDKDRVEQCLREPGIIRNRQKIQAAVKNARAFLTIQETHPSFNHYVWQWVDGVPRVHFFKTPQEVPALTPLSTALGADLKRRGFSFVGPRVAYAFMQAAGLVCDHLVCCDRHPLWHTEHAHRLKERKDSDENPDLGPSRGQPDPG